ncbi:hypothetical protein DC522_31475 [Microvirga sp. KLBC 81]|uniref:hypothetical protein n=1 Tax=Microvirga sp. KLBC 81 TaxID=1862707 RepID=UPI000D51B128|nr:hypothetical protein [Microvirga sp. KLBC 81]PVE20578.1 hypothetical protein DC522_31475 [Microvirga sp. KLBC 81]
MPASHLRLVVIDGSQVAPAPRRPRGWNVRREREEKLAIIREHLGHITHSMSRIQTLAGELEASLGISLPDFTPYPLPDRPDVSA